jgi:molecular chaperone GrpE (heat shock protein)
MAIDETVDSLRDQAARCREMAEKASDQEVAQALCELADDIDRVIEIVEASNNRTGAGNRASRLSS